MEARRITHADLWCQVEYATLCPFSAGNKWLLLQDGRGRYALHTGDGDFDRLTLIGHHQEPRWSADDPDVFYYLTGNQITAYDAMTHESEVIHIFSEYVMFAPGDRNGIQGLGEGDIEGNIWALAGMRLDGKRDVFLFDVKTLRKSKVLTLEPGDAPQTHMKSGRVHGLDNVYATPSGNCQIGWYATGKDRFQGVELYDSDMRFIRQLAPVMAHNDVASYHVPENIYDRESYNDGRDILIWGSAADATINKNAIFAIENATGKRRQLLELDWKYAYHVSACSRDFCIVSTYAPDNSLPSQILKLELDGSGSELLTETGAVMMRNAEGGMAYNPTPRAAVSRDGTRIVYNSNGGDTSRGENYVDVFLLKLEETIPTIPKPEPPIVVKPEPVLDRSAEITALQQTITAMAREQESLHHQLAKVIGTLATAQQENTQLIDDRHVLRERVDQLTNTLVTAQAEYVPVHLLPGQGPWQFQARPDGLVVMADVLPDGTLRPVTNWREGNAVKFTAVRAEDGSEAWAVSERADNQK